MTRSWHVSFFVWCAGALLVAASSEAFTVDWARQIGSPNDDASWFESGDTVSAVGVSAVYIAGATGGNIAATNAGGTDVFLAKYNPAGTLQWSAQLGSPGYDDTHAITADALGNVFVGGWTQGAIGGPNAGSTDSFVSRYDVNGNLQWSRQVGTSTDDRAYGLAADGLGNVYMTGWTFGALAGPLVGSQNTFLYKYDAAGNQLWGRQLGVSPTIVGQAVTADSAGSVYITGLTWGNLAAPPAGFGDVFLTKYNTAGTLQWSAQLGSAVHEVGRAVATDSLGNVYVTGYTRGNLAGASAGDSDIFLLKYNAAGTLQWSKQLGTSGADYGDGIGTDTAGNVYLSGTTYGSLFGPNVGNGDLVVAMFDSAGNLLQSTQLGTPGDDFNNSISLDSAGAIYVSGSTNGTFGGPAAGGFDVYVVKFAVPEPSDLVTTFVLGPVCLIRRRSASGAE